MQIYLKIALSKGGGSLKKGLHHISFAKQNISFIVISIILNKGSIILPIMLKGSIAKKFENHWFRQWKAFKKALADYGCTERNARRGSKTSIQQGPYNPDKTTFSSFSTQPTSSERKDSEIGFNFLFENQIRKYDLDEKNSLDFAKRFFYYKLFLYGFYVALQFALL